MSIYFNQTNLTAGTGFASGSSNFPQGIYTSSIVGLSSINGVSYSGGGGGGSNFPTGLTIGTTTITPVVGGGVIADEQIRIGVANNSNPTCILNVGSVAYQKANGGDTVLFNTFDGANNNLDNIASINSNAPVTVGGSNLAFIQYGAQTADAAGVTITLPTAYKSVGYTVLLTPLDNPPVLIPFAKITAANEFIITGDTGENISWMTIGAL